MLNARAWRISHAFSLPGCCDASVHQHSYHSYTLLWRLASPVARAHAYGTGRDCNDILGY